MGRHSAPPQSPPSGARPALRPGAIVAALVAALVVVAVVVGVVVLGGDDGTTTARPPGSGVTTSAGSGASGQASGADPAATSPSASTSATGDPTSTTHARPPTLDLRLTGPSYVLVRLPNGRRLVDNVLHKGAHKAFRQPALVVTLGSAGAVDARVNGRLLRGGRVGQVRNFVAHRK